MAAARFCSDCGEQLTVKRVSSLPLRSFCSRCSPRYRRARVALIAAPILFTAIGFAAGQYTSSREPFYYIGTPIEPRVSRMAPAAEDTSAHSSEAPSRDKPLIISSSPVGTICGARTKSGKPCQRKVKGGGHCWQHR